MQTAKKILWMFFFLMPLLVLNAENVFANTADDDLPEVTAKVARISFLQGEVQIRRAGSEDWERAVQNLPVVEGDEIATETNARLEIQFDTYRFLRLEENSYLTLTSLRDEGVAISLPQGSLSVRILEFDKDGFFEIDAPKTTIAVQKAGTYRVDAGDKDDSEIRVTVTNDGEARVYSETSGFMLRDGRSAKVYIAGDLAGEWDIDYAARYSDDFDSWAMERDSIIARRLRDANYDKYYDRDFYGAEELNENGEWIFSQDYGYVWRPYQNVTSRYADWSPYRYGHWRWIPAYGWTWVNDEAWGWATYHHGRWVYYDNYWVWSPYGQHRPRRSWWRPALVIITTIGNNICWYPLPYGYGYHDYNRRYRHRRNNNNNNGGNNNPTPTPTPTPAPGGNTGSVEYQMKDRRNGVPRTGIVSIDASEFGRGKRDYRIPTQETAKQVFSKIPVDTESPPILPTFKELNGKVSQEILIPNTKITRFPVQTKTGADQRQSGIPLNEKLREQRVLGNRPPTPRTTSGGGETRDNSDTNTRGTGAVIRPQIPVTKQEDDDRGTIETTKTPRRDSPVVRPRQEPRNDSPPVYTPPVKREEPPPRQERREERRVETPQPRPEPRVESKPSPPPPPRSEPKSEPRKEESKPSPPPENRKGKPENR